MSAEKLAGAACVTCAIDGLTFGSRSSEAEAGCILVISMQQSTICPCRSVVRVEVKKNSVRLLICKGLPSVCSTQK
jgi:hypothetical protein